MNCHPPDPTRRRPRWVAGVGGVAFGGVTAAVVGADGAPLPGERDSLRGLHALAGALPETALVRLAELTDLVPLAVVGGLVGLTLVGLGRWRDLGYGLAVVGVVWTLNPVLKLAVGRPRPDLWPLPMEVSVHSFPSGHAADTVALAAALVAIGWTSGLRPVVVSGAVVAVVVVGLDQLMLGVHYPSDVLAGWLWAGAWAALVWSVWPAGRPSDSPRPGGSPHGPGG